MFFLCVKNQVNETEAARAMITQPMPMPAFAPSLKPPPFSTIPDVCNGEDENEGVVKDVTDFELEDEGVVKVVEDVEPGDAAMVEGAEPTTKVANSADGAGATKVSAVGMSQRIEPFV